MNREIEETGVFRGGGLEGWLAGVLKIFPAYSLVGIEQKMKSLLEVFVAFVGGKSWTNLSFNFL